MSHYESTRIDLLKIEREARHLRAQATARALSNLFAWMRRPRTAAGPIKARTA